MIPKVPRDSRGYRDYTQNEIEWIDFVTCMRSSGIGISTLVTYYQLFKDGAGTSTTVGRTIGRYGTSD